MTLRNFIGMLSDGNEIEQIYAVNSDGYVVSQFCYFEEETLADYHEFLVSSPCPPDEDELDSLYDEWQTFRDHLDNEIIKIDLLEREIHIRCCDELWDYDPEDDRDPFEI